MSEELDSQDSNVTIGMVFPTLADLIDALRQVPDGQLLMVGYVDANGDMRALHESDLQMTVDGRLKSPSDPR